MTHKILIAEDDPSILTAVSDLLSIEGYTVATASDGDAALEAYRKIAPDLLLLDVMMPKKNGYDVCREIRRTDAATPILMLTAKGEEIDKVLGLELGADDYIVKPFGMAELLARVRAALRKSALIAAPAIDHAPKTIIFDDVTVDFESMSGTNGKETFNLTPKETEMLRLLVANEGKVVSRETLLERVWGIDCEITTRSVDQHMLRLRQKIERDPANPKFLHTAHGAGYKFERKP
ncbi:response regulator transcription factor [Synergistaceae bacterium OttesenSCG-928-D05]|nr:response regulator transcription factor [Synergistaceae bacterium OttesenSCG-928-D05]